MDLGIAVSGVVGLVICVLDVVDLGDTEHEVVELGVTVSDVDVNAAVFIMVELGQPKLR